MTECQKTILDRKSDCKYNTPTTSITNGAQGRPLFSSGALYGDASIGAPY